MNILYHWSQLSYVPLQFHVSSINLLQVLLVIIYIKIYIGGITAWYSTFQIQWILFTLTWLTSLKLWLHYFFLVLILPFDYFLSGSEDIPHFLLPLISSPRSLHLAHPFLWHQNLYMMIPKGYLSPRPLSWVLNHYIQLPIQYLQRSGHPTNLSNSVCPTCLKFKKFCCPSPKDRYYRYDYYLNHLLNLILSRLAKIVNMHV